MLVELFPITILRKAKLNYTPYTCCLLVVVGNKRYFLESEVCRGHLTRKQHCNLDSERRSLINIQTTCHLLVSPHLALGLSCRGLTKMGSYLEDYYRRYNENISRWPGYQDTS